MPQPDYGLLNLASRPLNVVNVRCSVFKDTLDARKYVPCCPVLGNASCRLAYSLC